MEQWMPHPEGKTGSDKVAKGILRPLSYSARDTLATLATTGVLFTHAVCLSHLPVPTDPLVDFLSRRPDLDVGVLVCDRPFFMGFNKPWNNALLWVANEQWPSVRDFLSSCLFRAPLLGLWECGWCETKVPDQLLLKQSAILPCVWEAPAWVLTLRTEKSEIHVYSDPAPECPTVVRLGVRNADRDLPAGSV